MRRLALTLALVLVPSFAWADAPKATATVKDAYKPGSLVIIDGSKSVGDSFKWVAFDGDDCLAVNGDKQLVFASGTPGQYKFLLVASGVVDGKGVSDTATIVVTIAGTAPPAPSPTPTPVPPGPTPDPTPVPPPAPVVSGRLYGVYVIDAANMKPAHVAMRRNVVIDKELAGLDAAFRVYESTEDELAKDRLNLLAEAQKIGLPAFVVMTKDGTVVAKAKDPSPSDVVAAFKKLRGK